MLTLITVWSLQKKKKVENWSSGFRNSKTFEGFYVLTASLLTIQVFWDTIPCWWVKVTDILQELHASISRVHSVCKMGSNKLSETSVTIYQSTHYIQEDLNLQQGLCWPAEKVPTAQGMPSSIPLVIFTHKKQMTEWGINHCTLYLSFTNTYKPGEIRYFCICAFNKSKAAKHKIKNFSFISFMKNVNVFFFFLFSGNFSYFWQKE